MEKMNYLINENLNIVENYLLETRNKTCYLIF